MFKQPTDLPIDQVRALRARGYDNNQIVQALQRNGYSSTQIFDALNQADLVSGAPQDPYAAPAPPPMASDAGMQDYSQQEYAQAAPAASNEDIEEVVESIIEEKWESLSKDIIKIVDWKNEVETRIAKIEQRIDGIKDEFDKLHQAVIGKIGEYDKNILSVGAEIKAMEKVFSKVLPVFTENVNELDRITRSLKQNPQS